MADKTRKGNERFVYDLEGMRKLKGFSQTSRRRLGSEFDQWSGDGSGCHEI